MHPLYTLLVSLLHMVQNVLAVLLTDLVYQSVWLRFNYSEGLSFFGILHSIDW